MDLLNQYNKRLIGLHYFPHQYLSLSSYMFIIYDWSVIDNNYLFRYPVKYKIYNE